MMRRYLLAWVPMIFIAIANGALREAFLTPALGELPDLAWRDMLSEYNIFAGKLWLLVPLWVAVAPYLFYRIQR